MPTYLITTEKMATTMRATAARRLRLVVVASRHGQLQSHQPVNNYARAVSRKASNKTMFAKPEWLLSERPSSS